MSAGLTAGAAAVLNRKQIQADFCVVGGGMAGICAAIQAARGGLRTVLMHERPMLGGNASSEIRMWICGARGVNNRETGILEEIELENLYRNPTKNYYVWDMLLLDFVRREKNITLLLNCACIDARVDSGVFAHGRTARIRQVTGYQLTTQTFVDVAAALFADCSGDSILAPLTGALCRIGREARGEFGEDVSETADSKTMGMTCALRGRETGAPVPFTAPDFARKICEKDFTGRRPDLRNCFENFWYLELGGEGDTIADTDKTAEELMALNAGVWDYLKQAGGAENWELDYFGFLPGKRESRRMTGEYTLTQHDIMNAVTFADTVAYGGWPLDDHDPAGFARKATANTSIPTASPYPIAYRALYSKNVDNLLFAGRNISATHIALSSTRVMGICALLGQAVGAAAALAVRFGLTPHGVLLEKIRTLQAVLLDSDCFLPGLRRSVSPFCLEAALVNGSGALRDGEDRPHPCYGTETCGVKVNNLTSIEYRFSMPARVETVHLVFDSDINRLTLPGDRCEREHAMRANTRLDSPAARLPSTLCRDFRLEAVTAAGRQTLLDIRNNRRRYVHIPAGIEAAGLALTPLSNWGAGDQTAVFSFDFM